MEQQIQNGMIADFFCNSIFDTLTQDIKVLPVDIYLTVITTIEFSNWGVEDWGESWFSLCTGWLKI